MSGVKKDTWMRTTPSLLQSFFLKFYSWGSLITAMFKVRYQQLSGTLIAAFGQAPYLSAFWILIFYRPWSLSSASTPFLIRTSKIFMKLNPLFSKFSTSRNLITFPFSMKHSYLLTGKLTPVVNPSMYSVSKLSDTV